MSVYVFVSKILYVPPNYTISIYVYYIYLYIQTLLYIEICVVLQYSFNKFHRKNILFYGVLKTILHYAAVLLKESFGQDC